jgi:hypothetical protein
MNKRQLIDRIEDAGKYHKVRIAKDNTITGMLVNEDYRYDIHTDTGGRRYIGQANDNDLLRYYDD